MANKQPTDFQRRCMEKIAHADNRMLDINRLAYSMKSNRLAIHSAMFSLEKKGLAGHIRSRHDQWGIFVYFLRKVEP